MLALDLKQLNLHSKQEEIRALVNDSPYRVITAVIGRQWGKSYLDRALCLEWAGNLNKNVMWVSPSIPSARSHWRELVKKIKNFPNIEINHSAKQIVFPNGGVITIRSAVKPDNIRGESVDLLIMDEAAFYLNGSYIFWQVCIAMITASGGKILVTTTPNGRNWTYEVFRKGLVKGQSFYKSVHYPSDTSPTQDIETLAVLKESMPSLSWRVEYLAEFLADGGGTFAGVERASNVTQLTDPIDGHTYVCGIDVGHNNDPTCITFIDKYTRQQVAGYSFTDVGTVAPLRRIIGLLDWWSPETTAVETNGVGTHFFTLMKEVMSGALDDIEIMALMNETVTSTEKVMETIVGGHRLIGVHMDNIKKRSYVERLSADIEYTRVAILDQESEYGMTQVSEMSTYTKKRTVSGVNVTYSALDGEHDDTITALYLAYSLVPKHRRKRNPRKGKKEAMEKRANPFRSGKKRRF